MDFFYAYSRKCDKMFHFQFSVSFGIFNDTLVTLGIISREFWEIEKSEWKRCQNRLFIVLQFLLLFDVSLALFMLMCVYCPGD